MKVEKIKLKGFNSIEGEIECLTGLRIGGGSEVIEIGGLDNPVIKHPVTKEAYIPGSSMKGKMRSLLELIFQKVGGDGKVHEYSEECGFECPICRIFGVGGSKGSPFGPGRLIVRDATIYKINGQPPWAIDNKLTEIKWENVIDRIKGTAEHPRQMERVPSGAIFKFRMDYRVFSLTFDDGTIDDGTIDQNLFNTLLKGLKLIELDTLGGSGSRGYGRVSFGEVMITHYDGTVIKQHIGGVLLNS